MNDPAQRKRLFWGLAICGVLLFSLLFISLFAPSSPGGNSEPVLRLGAEASATATPAARTTTGGAGFSLGGGDLFSLAWRLVLVAIIIGVSIVGLRWWGRKTAGPKSTTGFLKVVDTLAISNGRSIHLVALGDRVIAVGATAQQLTLLNELTDAESSEVLTQQPQGADQPLAAFATELFQQMRGKNSRLAVRGHFERDEERR